MNPIRWAGAYAATAVAALATVAASGCGGAAPAVSVTTNGLEHKSPTQVLQEAAAALKAATSAHIVASGLVGGKGPYQFHVDVRIQGSSATGTLVEAGMPIEMTIIGNDDYVKAADPAGEKKLLGAPRADTGRWLKIPPGSIPGYTLASFASQLATHSGAGPLDQTVRQATLDGRKVVVVSWRNGSTLECANTGPAYPLRGEFKGPKPGYIDFTEYDARFQITPPSKFIDLSHPG